MISTPPTEERYAMDCVVYRCSRQDEMYLFVKAGLDLTTLPAPLRSATGRLTQVMELRITPERRLARADTARVLAALREKGYYVQLPPDGQVQAHLTHGG